MAGRLSAWPLLEAACPDKQDGQARTQGTYASEPCSLPLKLWDRNRIFLRVVCNSFFLLPLCCSVSNILQNYKNLFVILSEVNLTTLSKTLIMHIAIAGNIGSGKTTLTRLLSKHYGWEPKYEEVDQQPLSSRFLQTICRGGRSICRYFFLISVSKVLSTFR